MNEKMRGAGGKSVNHSSSARHSRLQKSTTLNRKFVKRPEVRPRVMKREDLQREAFLRRQARAEEMNRQNLLAARKKSAGGKIEVRVETEVAMVPEVEKAEEVVVANEKLAEVKARVAARKAEAPRQLSASELKERAIKQALSRVATMGDSEEDISDTFTEKRKGFKRRKFAIAFVMAAVSIGLLGYLVHLNLPDLSVRVAAMQSGIEGSYPSYVPREYRMEGLVSEGNGKIVLNFVTKDDRSFSLTEEKSSWDSAALLTQFVEPRWDDEYTTLKEQGLTIYVSGSDAVWVNGGIFYHIDDAFDGLSKQQLHDIAVSI